MEQIPIKSKNRCGIYSIFNLENGKKYVGSSINLYNRLHEHLHNLRNNKAHNKHLQAAWNKYGEESFKFNILEYCETDEQYSKEQYYIDLIHPEYNFAEQVIATYGREISEETKKKISETLKKKYKSGELSSYIRRDIMIKCYIYNIINWAFIKECESLREAGKVINVTNDSVSGLKKTIGRIYCDKYIIIQDKFNTVTELKNYFYENYVKAISKNIAYLGVIDKNELIYFRSYSQCAKYIGCSPETLKKQGLVSIDNPYRYKNSDVLYFAINNYVPLKNTAVPIEQSMERSLSRVGGSPKMDNTEVIEETKESSVSVQHRD